jgi:hypothetical protein
MGAFIEKPNENLTTIEYFISDTHEETFCLSIRKEEANLN